LPSLSLACLGIGWHEHCLPGLGLPCLSLAKP
jgi:hypothetical protein